MNSKLLKLIKFSAIFFVAGFIFFISAPQAEAAKTCALTLGASASWSTASWTGAGCDGSGSNYPGSTSGDTATINTTAASVVLTLNVNPANSLTSLTFNNPSSSSGITLAIGTSIISTGSLTLSGSSSTRSTKVTIGTGTLTVTGNISFVNANDTITCSGNSVINIGGTLGASGGFTASTSTVTFNGSGAQTINAYTFNNVVIANTASPGTRVTGTGTTFAIGGTLAVNDGEFVTNSGTTFSVTSSTTIADGASLFLGGSTNTTFTGTVAVGGGTSGVLSCTSGATCTGTKTFSNTITVNAGGTFNLSNGTVAPTGVTLGGTGGIAHSGSTFNMGAAVTFSGTGNYPISGSSAMTFPGLVTILAGRTPVISNSNTVSFTASPTGLALASPATANSLTINNGSTVTVTNALSFTANATSLGQTITLGSGASGHGDLNIGSLTINTPTGASANTKSLITCNANASQTGTLTITGSGTAEITGSSTASGTGAMGIDMSPGGCNVITGTGAVTLTGGSVGPALLKMGVGTLTANGNITFAGTAGNAQLTTVSGSTITFNGTSTVSTGGTATVASTTTLNVQNNATATWNYATSNWSNVTITSGATFAPGANLQTITGNLTCGSGGAGTATISGSGGLTFTGASAILNNAGGAGSTCAVTNSGTFLVSGGTAPTVSANAAYTFTGSLSVTTALANSGTVTANNAASLITAGSGNFTNASGATLNIAGTSTITTITPANAANTINYTGTAQTVHAAATNPYWHLGFSGSGSNTVSLPGSITAIAGNLTLSGTANVTTGASLVVTGLTSIATGATLNQGATFNFTTGAAGSGGLTTTGTGIFSNISTGQLTLGGPVANAGTIILNSNNGSSCVDGANSILVRSTVNNTTRAWSGAGTFTLRNLDVDDMTGSLTAEKSVFSGDTTWTEGCTTVTVADGSNPSDVTIGPGASATDLDAFTLARDIGTDTVTALTVTLAPSSSYNNIAQVDITDNSNSAQCTAITNPASLTLNFTGCSLAVTTTPTTFKVRVTPKTHANMPSGAGTLSIDSSSPAAATSETAATVTTASFTPPAGSVLYIGVTMATDNGGSSPNHLSAIGDNLGGSSLTYNLVTKKGTEDGSESLAYLYTAVVGSSQAMTVSVTNSQGNGQPTMLSVIVVTGADTGTPTGASGGNRIDTGPISGTDAQYNSTRDNSWGWLIYNDWAVGTLPTLGASQSTHHSFSATAGDAFAMIKQNSVTATSGTQVTMSTTAPSGSQKIAYIYFEMMPATGSTSSYATTGTVTSITATGTMAGSDAASATVTIDNAAPAAVTSSTVTPGAAQNALAWTNPADSDFTTSGTVLVLRRTSSGVTDTPVEGTTYSVGNTIGSSTVACVVTGSPPATSCTDGSLSNGTPYYYKIFTQDSRGNYNSGTVPTGSPATPVGSSTCTSQVTSGNWNTSGTWDCGHVPTTTDVVIIRSTDTITMNVDSAVLGTITINGVLTTSGTSYALSGTTINITSTGTLTANNSTITLSATSGTIFTKHATGTFTAGGSTVVMSGNGDATVNSGTVAFASLTSSGTGTKTLGADITLSGNLLISAGQFLTSTAGITVTGTTTISNGTFNDNSATGTNIFIGAVTVSSNGTWATTTGNPSHTFRGGLTVNSPATFSSGSGTYTFDTNAQTISGTQAFTITNLTNNVTTSTGLTISTSNLTATALTQSSNAILTISAAPTLTALTATASGNIVNYTAAAPNCKVVSYYHLNFTGSGSVTCAVTTVGGDLATSGTVSWTTGANLAVTGNLTVGTGTTFTTGANFTLSVTGTSTTNGTGTLALSNGGAKTLVGLVTINNTGTFTVGGGSVEFRGGLTNSSGGTITIASPATFTTTASQSLGGANSITFSSTVGIGTGVTLTNSNTGTVTMSGTVTLTGNLTQGTTTNILTLGAATPFSGAGAFTASGNNNTVNYTGSSQAVFATTYHNLTINGSGTATVGGTTVVNNTLTATSAITNNSTLTVTGSLAGGTLTNGAAGTLNIGFASAPSITTLTATASGNIVNYTAAAPNCKVVSYYHLNFTGSGSVTCAVTTVGGDLATSGTVSWTTGANLAVTGNLTVGTGTTFTTGANFTLSVTGTSTTNGTGTLALSNGGAKTLVGLVTINNTGTFTVGGGSVEFRGGLTNSSGGTITIASPATFTTTASQSLGGANSITFSSTVGIGTGVTLTNSNTGTVTMSGTVTLTGNLTQGTTTNILTLGAATPFSGAGAFTASGNNNTVNYTGSSQAVFATTYHNLTINGSGTATVGGTTVVNNTLTATSAITNNSTLTVTGSLAGGTLTNGAAGTLNIGFASAPSITTLTATASGNIVNYTAAAPNCKVVSYYHLNFTGSGSVTCAVTTVGGDLGLSGTVSWSTTSDITVTGATNIGTGTSLTNATTRTFISPTISITSSGSMTNNNIVTVNTALSGTGTLTQGAGSTLNLAGSSGITTLNASTNANTVNYTGAAQAIKVINYSSLTLSGSGTATGAVTNVAAALSLSGTVSWAEDAITTTMTSVTMNSTGTLTLGANMATSGALTVTQGTFNANNLTVSAASVSSSNSNTRAITMGSGTWTISGTGTVWDTATTTGMTLTPNASTIKLTNNSSSLKTFSGGGLTYNNIWFAPATGTGSFEVRGSNTFADFKDDGTIAHSILFTAGSTNTFTTFTVTGNSGQLITINSSDGAGSTSTSTHALVKSGGGVITSDYLSIQHSVATPSSTWYAGANSTNNQGISTIGSGWIFTGVPFRYWVGGGSSANWSATSPTNWSYASNGSNNATVPDSTTDVYFDGVGAGASASTISAGITIKSLDMTGYTNILTHNAGTTLTISGNTFKLVSGMTYTKGDAATSAVSFTSTTGSSGSPALITTAGKTLGNTTFNGSGGYFQLNDSLTANTITQTAGTILTNATLTMSSASTASDWTIGTAITKNSGSDSTLTVKSGKAIVVSGAITSTSNKLNLVLQADSGANTSGYINVAAAITTNGGTLTMGGGSGTISAGSGYAVGNSGQASGILINNVNVNAGGGVVILNGQGYNTTTNSNLGIRVTGASGILQTSGSGTITLSGLGKGTSNSASNYGIEVDTGGILTTQGGNLTVSATGGGAGTGTNNFGLYVTGTNSTVKTTGSGNLIINGIRGSGDTATNYGLNVEVANGLQTTSSGTITVNTDTIKLAEVNDINSVGALTIAPYTASGTVGVAGGAGTLGLTSTFLGYLNYTSLQIGNSAQTGTTTLGTYASWAKPTTFSTNASGSIAVAGAQTNSDVFTFDGPTTLSAGITAPSMTIASGTFDAGAQTVDLNGTSGTLLTVSGGSLNGNASTFNLSASSGTPVISSGSATFNNLTISGGGNKTMGADIVASGVLTLTAGTLSNSTSTSYNVTAASFSSSNTNTRTVFMGNTSLWTLTGTGTVWDTSTTTGLTIAPGFSTLRITDTSSTGKTFAGGGKTYNNFWYDPGSGTGSMTISGNNTFKDFKDTGGAAHSLIFTAGSVQHVGTWNVVGHSGNLITVNSTSTSTFTLFKDEGGTIASNYLNIQHSIAVPFGVWFAGDSSVNNQSQSSAGSGWIFYIPTTFKGGGSNSSGGETTSGAGTCSDGVQNGNETGIDSGGRCATYTGNCSDGVQNGNETGTDTGGRCNFSGGTGGGGGEGTSGAGTCTDGVQNGNETGIDSGGRCAALSGDCSDGIQNGNETGVDTGGRCGAGGGGGDSGFLFDKAKTLAAVVTSDTQASTPTTTPTDFNIFKFLFYPFFGW